MSQTQMLRKQTRAISLAKMVLTYKCLYGMGDNKGAEAVYLAILASRFPGTRREAALNSIAKWRKDRPER